MKKTILLTAALFLSSLNIFAQVPIKEWQKPLGGSGAEEANSIQQTDDDGDGKADDGYIVAGFTNSNDGDVSGLHLNSMDFWVVKLNAGGDTAWTKCFGGSNTDQAYSIQQTADRGYIVAGYTASNDGDVVASLDVDGSGNHGGNDFWVIKLDRTGNLSWQNALGGIGDEEAYSIWQTSDKGYIVAGSGVSSDGDALGDVDNSAHQGGKDFWIVKLNETGNLIWKNALGGSNPDIAYSVQQTSDGGYIAAGSTASNDKDVMGNHWGMGAGFSDYWVVKLNSAGVPMWKLCLGGPSNDIAYSIQQTDDDADGIADDGYIVAGMRTREGMNEYWVVKLLPDNLSAPNTPPIINWDKDLGRTGSDIAFSIQQTAEGGYVVAGESESNNGSGTHYKDFFVVKLSPSSVKEWQIPLGGPNYESAKSVRQTAEGGYIVAGYITPGSIIPPAQPNDFWVVKLCIQTNHYPDADGDTFGDAAAIPLPTCPLPGYVENNTDCDDNPATGGSINAPVQYYVDADLDHYGSTATAMVCSSTPPDGYSTNNTDCDDNPGRGESIHIPPGLSFGIFDHIHVAGGTLDLHVSGPGKPFSYSWTHPDGSISIQEDISNTKKGVYTVTVTPFTGSCSATTSVTVSPPLVNQYATPRPEPPKPWETIVSSLVAAGIILFFLRQ